MIEKQGHKIELVCDTCGITALGPYQNSDFDVMIADAKEDDWEITNEEGEWIHNCPNCVD